MTPMREPMEVAVDDDRLCPCSDNRICLISGLCSLEYLEQSTSVAWGGDGLPHVECECSVHETTIAATAPLGAINELLLREAVAFIL